MKFQDSSFNGLKVTVGTKSVTHPRTHPRTHAPKAICPINFFKVGGIKTLGINHGYEVDENEIWMEKVNKIKSCIQIWKSRNLSYVGKGLIIKTLLASQIGFLAHIKPVPNNVIKLIESLMWNFLWNNKQPLVNRKTMYLKQSEGGVKMLNLREFIESKQINFMYKIIKSEYEHWNIIGKGWLKTFDTDYNIDYFVCKCTSVKGLCLKEIPKYYQDCISAWTKLNGILMQKKKTY